MLSELPGSAMAMFIVPSPSCRLPGTAGMSSPGHPPTAPLTAKLLPLGGEGASGETTAADCRYGRLNRPGRWVFAAFGLATTIVGRSRVGQLVRPRGDKCDTRRTLRSGAYRGRARATLRWRWAAELVSMMSGFFQRIWSWLACENNRGRVIAISMVIGAIIAAITLVVHLQTPASEVRMSVSDFQDALERRAEKVRNDLATAHGEERILLENENAEIARQLADVQAAYAERQERIGELEASLARLSTDVDDDGLADARTALEAGDFSKADALLAAIEARADVAVARAAEAAFRRGQIAATQIRWGEAAAHFDKAARLDPVYDHLKQAGSFAWRSGRYATALRHLRDLLDLSRRDHGEGSPKTATAFNDLANLLRALGRLRRRSRSTGRRCRSVGRP